MPAEKWKIRIAAYRILKTLLCFSVVELASGTISGSARVNIKGANTNWYNKENSFLGMPYTTPLYKNCHQKSTKVRKQSSKKIQNNQIKESAEKDTIHSVHFSRHY